MRRSLDHEFVFTPRPDHFFDRINSICEECGERAEEHWCGCCMRDTEYRQELQAEIQALRTELNGAVKHG